MELIVILKQMKLLITNMLLRLMKLEQTVMLHLLKKIKHGLGLLSKSILLNNNLLLLIFNLMN